MSAVKRVAQAAETIRARWEQQVSTDPQTEAAQALEDTGQLLDPDVAAELVAFRKARVLAAAVAEHGPFPMPVGPVLRSELDQAHDDIAGACLARWESEQENERLRWALASARRGRSKLRAQVAALLAERHSTNEALSKADVQRQADRDRIAELEKREAVVAEFVSDRAGYITAINNCHPDNAHDYNRWQGHAESRRQLAGQLGLPVAWPSEYGQGDVTPQVRKLRSLLAGQRGVLEDPHDGPLAHTYRVGHDLPEAGGVG